MIETDEYYGGTYPEPPEFEEEDNEDYEWQYADERYELEKLEMI